MLLEALAWATLPASWPIRRMGYVSEMVGIGARALRCRESWRPHLKKSRGFLAEAMARPARKRRALIFGSGLLLDVPVADLAVAYDEVWLVDILQPLSARLRALFSPKLSLFAHDATEAIAPLHDAVRAWRLAGRDKDRPPPLPDIAPARFLDQEFDLVASVNLASQLPIVPRAWLTRGCAAITEA
ncbi:MAG: hypothetical protein FJX47_02645, partial [Alphaproteobacteria bacterium]|nr:hypothetical protein [Alphaproteobacteria bacterium]